MTKRIPTNSEIAVMTDTQRKVFENRLRRAAHRQGRRLRKSRARDPQAVGYGTYTLIDDAANFAWSRYPLEAVANVVLGWSIV